MPPPHLLTPGKTDHIPVVSGGYKIFLLVMGFHQSGQDKTAEPIHLAVGIREIKELS